MDTTESLGFLSAADSLSREAAIEKRVGFMWTKLLRAHGGCLGVRRLRRAWKTAKSSGELLNEC